MNKNYCLHTSEKLSGATSWIGTFRDLRTKEWVVAWFNPNDGKIEFESDKIDIISPPFSNRGIAAVFEMGFKTGWERA